MSEESLDRPINDLRHAPPVDEARRRLFDDRYGASAFADMMRLFASPCVTYAEIAKRFGVTRERVRQWHLTLAPDSPRGHQRRRLCQAYRRKRLLLDEPVFGAFVRTARAQVPEARVQPVATASGFRKRLVRLGGWTIALKAAAATRRRQPGDPASYSLAGSRSRVDFLFYQLEPETYLFIPAPMIPASGTTFLDVPSSKYAPFKNRLCLPDSAPSS